eukprot:COSAG02_NODE_10344_length_1963_cov_1.792382_2_plen_133_part_01
MAGASERVPAAARRRPRPQGLHAFIEQLKEKERSRHRGVEREVVKESNELGPTHPGRIPISTLRSAPHLVVFDSDQGETQLGWSLREFSEPTPCLSEQSFTPLNNLVSQSFHIILISNTDWVPADRRIVTHVT